jgi:ectoine hydroxylase-related dioxygenase (phytanoyl-CoA dioxygenase family)
MPFLDTTKLVFYYDFLIVKAPRSDSASTPWHHDVSYYPFDGRKMMNCWTALDEIPLDTSLRFWRGSHKLQQVYRAKHFDPNKKYANLMMERPLPPDIEADPLAYDIISCGMQPGDTLIFSSRTVHSAPGNFREKRRAALSTNWLGDDVTYFDLPQQMDPPDRGEGLVDGGPVECASFPRVR